MKQYVVGASMMMAVFASGTTHANLITNGDFATDSSGWTYNNQGVDGGYAGTLGNPAGSFWINHNGNNVGSDADPMISQTIATATGNPYILSFDFIARVIAGPKGFAVDINGVESGTYDLGGAWATETVNFSATGPSTTISFRSEINGTDYDALVDNVSVVQDPSAIPVPAAGLLGLAGIGMLTMLGARRKKAA